MITRSLADTGVALIGIKSKQQVPSANNSLKMLPEIKINISQNGKLLKSISKTTEKVNIIKSLEEFQVEANATITRMIEELGEASGENNMANGDEDGENDDEAKDKKNKDDNAEVKNKQSERNEQNGESKPKKKRCG